MGAGASVRAGDGVAAGFDAGVFWGAAVGFTVGFAAAVLSAGLLVALCVAFGDAVGLPDSSGSSVLPGFFVAFGLWL